MAEGGVELDDYLDKILEEDADADDAETSFMNISEDNSTAIHQQEEALQQYTGDVEVSQRERLKRDKVDAFIKEIRFRTEGKLVPTPTIYTEFVLGKDGRTLYLITSRMAKHES